MGAASRPPPAVVVASGYEYFLDEDRALGYAREAVRQALVNLEAVDAPAGTLTVVLGPAGRACCSTRRWATAWRVISIARAPRRSADVSARRWPPTA
jgi:hypothetical protein